MWWAALAAAAVAIVTRWLPAGDAESILRRIAPVLVFLVAITVVAQLAQNAGVFDAAAHVAARVGRGRTWVLWLLMVALATSSTIVLSLDTTAVLLTPVALALAVQVGISPALFAMTTVWLADTASMLLPVSNLTNLLALHRLHDLGVGLAGYVSLTWLPALVAVVVTVAVLAVMFRRDLRTTYAAPEQPAVEDRVLLWSSAGVCLLLGPAFATEVQPAWPASIGAVVLVLLFAVRRRSDLRASHVPWRLVLLVIGLFFVVQTLQVHGLPQLLAHVAGSGNGWPDHLRLATTGALGANGVDNLPAYLALEPVADSSPARLVALLLGVNCGPLLTMWASLATLLWRERCRAAGVEVSPMRFFLRGLVVVPILLVTTTAALSLTA
ncbi:MAG: SLC13 family permease [Actinomycetota bacterium]|nr:SLC13 family permease [Actinomycetota bacterium]